jgi:hypothetical protein
VDAAAALEDRAGVDELDLAAGQQPGEDFGGLRSRGSSKAQSRAKPLPR